MKTALETCQAIHDLRYGELFTQGIEILEAYVEQERGKLTATDITSKLLSYANDKLKSILSKAIPPPFDQYFGKMVCVGVTVERTIQNSAHLRNEKGEIAPENFVVEEEYKGFTTLLNKAADRELICGNLLALGPYKMQLAVISPSFRTLIRLCCQTTHNLHTLKEVSNMFCSEGELPPLLQHIYFRD